ncbi:MAG TPA: ABC transporter permease [Bacteriovoracaceae bacterium]|nr:ABC transporter permease [Bacteriovoracaceae bacterium]
MLTTIDHLGKAVFDLCRSLSRFILFIYLSFRCALTLDYKGIRPILFTIVSQIYFTGFKALPLITFIALATGSIIVLQSTAQLTILGSQEMMGNILVVTIIRELGPLLTALIVIARSGTAVASELGNMKLNKEVDALCAMSIEPLSFIVFPRIIGGMISLICLAFYFNCIALIGGYVVGSFLSDLSFTFYVDVISQAVAPSDFIMNVFKNIMGGLIIFATASYQGLKVENGPHEVPMATTRSVVNSIMAVVAFNLSITIYVFARALS